MSPGKPNSLNTLNRPRIAELADRLSTHIADDGLRPGDPFLTAAEASRLLGVGTTAANRALQLLHQRRVIVRRRRTGSVIAHKTIFPSQDHPLLRVHFLVHQQYLRTEGLTNDGILVGLQGELPASTLSLNFLPVGNEVGFVESLIRESSQRGNNDGFVLVRAPLEVQRLVAASGLPAVVHGNVYPTIDNLSSVDRDSFEIGRVLAEYHLRSGKGRVVYVTRQQTFPGDNETIDGVLDVLKASGCGFDSILLRTVPADDAVVQATVARVAASRAESTGIICRTASMAENAERALESYLKPRQAWGSLSVCDYYLREGQHPRFVFAKPGLSPEDRGRLLGRSLRRQAAGELATASRDLIPIQLEVPDPPASCE
jgi:DNA-binding transcriptional regulator YhcF (GntR family)